MRRTARRNAPSPPRAERAMGGPLPEAWAAAGDRLPAHMYSKPTGGIMRLVQSEKTHSSHLWRGGPEAGPSSEEDRTRLSLLPDPLTAQAHAALWQSRGSFTWASRRRSHGWKSCASTCEAGRARVRAAQEQSGHTPAASAEGRPSSELHQCRARSAAMRSQAGGETLRRASPSSRAPLGRIRARWRPPRLGRSTGAGLP